ncbi:MAG: hypothetical protein EZS28_028376, partial [Streblomastix strix]
SYNNRNASSLPSHQSSGRDATLSMLQLQWSLLQLQKNAVWSFNGSENLYQMPPSSGSRGQEAMQLENLRLRRRYSDPELGSRNITTRDIASNDDSTGVWMDNRNGQELDQSHADSGVLGLAVEHENNDNANDNIPKERNLEMAKTSDGTSLEKEARKNKGLGIRNWRDPIHKSTIQTRRASHQHNVIAHVSARFLDFTERANKQTDSKGQDKTSTIQLQKALFNTSVLTTFLNLIKRKYEWDNSIANDNKQLGLRIRCCQIFQSIQRIGGASILEQLVLNNYIVSFFSEIYAFWQSFGLRRISITTILPQVKLNKISEEQIEEEGVIEEIDVKLLNDKSFAFRRIAGINQINVMQAILNISSVNNPNIDFFHQIGVHDIFRRQRRFFPGIINNNNIEGDNKGP